MYLFVVTHFGSGASSLVNTLTNHPRISYSPHEIYSHPYDLTAMKDRYAKIFFDRLDLNQSISSPSILQCAKFIYFIRDPIRSLPNIVHQKNYSERGAVNYYCFRLRRIYEIARSTPGLFLTYDDFVTHPNLVFDWLGLTESPLGSCDENEKPVLISERAEERYEHYLELIKNCVVS